MNLLQEIYYFFFAPHIILAFLSFTSFTTFNALSGFNPGVNTLVFRVQNLAGGTNPTGLRVEFTSSSVTAVPEPETYAMFLAGLGVVGFVAARRRPS